MATEKQEYSQIGLTKKPLSQTVEELCSLVPPTTFRSLRPPSFTGEVIIIDDDDEEETLEAKEKKPKLGSWWDDVYGLNELSSVSKGLPKSKDAASTVDSSFSSTSPRETRKEKDERSLSSSHHDNFTDLCEDKSYCDSNHKGNQYRMQYGHVSLEDLGVAVEDPWLGSYIVPPPLDSCFASPSTHLLKRETNTKKDDERSLQSSHHDNFIDLSKDEILGEGSSSSNKGNRHVSLAELGVSVEDLKSMPWEAFTWEIRSETMDPWLGGYIKDMFPATN